MKRVYIYIVQFVIAITASYGQDTILNAYAKVLEIDSCFLRVDTSLGFYPEDFVLLHQSKGALITKSNTAAYGTLKKYEGAGLFEENRIQFISNDTIYLYKQVSRPFNVKYGVQIVGIRPVNKIISTQQITALPWDSSKGGIVYLKARDSVVLNEDIDVSGLGYNGGKVSETRVRCNYDEFFCDYKSGFGGEKGESMVFLDQNTACRGASANGGGGGNTSNTGGGGGANAGSGGLGGKEVSFGSGSCSNPRVGGVGGIGIQYDTLFGAIPRNSLQRLFFGGGGGGGQQNNEASDGVGGVAGMPGGGIIFINTPQLVSKNIAFNTNGKSVIDTAGRDGAGGGGAGGTVALFCDKYVGKITINANGGNGGSVDNNGFNSFCHGPGGGGGGGLLWLKQLSLPNNFSFSANRGLAGLNVNTTSKCYNQTHGAENGTAGYVLYDLKLNLAGPKRASCPSLLQVAVNDSFSTFQGAPIGFNILKNDTTVGIYTVKINPRSSQANIKKINKDSLVYTNSSVGTDTFEYCLCRKYEPIICDTALVVVKVLERKLFVDLKNDTIVIDEGDSLLIDILKNDSLLGKYRLCLDYKGPNKAQYNADSSSIAFSALNRNLGIDSFKYCACLIKNPSLCDTAWVFVNINADTTAPVAVNDKYEFIKGLDTCIYPLLNDTFKRAISYNLARNNQNLNLTFKSDSSLCFSNSDALSDSLEIVYQICYLDSPKTCDTATISIVFIADSLAPKCVDDSFFVYPDSFKIVNVLTNDLLKTTISFEILTQPSQGTISVNSPTEIRYSPATSFSGVDSFLYKVVMSKSSFKSDSAWARFYIPEPNLAPIAVDDYYQVFKNDNFLFNPLENDSDPNSGIVFKRFGKPFYNGNVLENVPPFTYTPSFDFVGADTATYSIIDITPPIRRASAKIYIQVIDKPAPKIPNGFSPNADGINDRFIIENAELFADLHLVVYNRYGQVLYDNVNYKNNWEGTTRNGEPLTDGTYFYLVRIESVNYKKEGYVVINR